MVARVAVAGLLLGAVGCVPWESQTILVPPGMENAPVVDVPRRAPRFPATEEAGRRAGAVARKIVEANRQTGLRPAIHTIGGPNPEVFHVGTEQIFVTEGLVKECTDGQLAAVLCLELGKMVSEREALASPAARLPERLPPPEPAVGVDRGATIATADGTRQVEMARYDRERVRPGQPLAAPDPSVLARTYLKNAGYPTEELAAAAPILRKAEDHATFEKQISTMPAATLAAPTPVPEGKP